MLTHPPLFSPHLSVYVPYSVAVATAVAELISSNETVPGPVNISVHVPVPTVGTAARVIAFDPQTSSLPPAAATGFLYTVKFLAALHG